MRFRAIADSLGIIMMFFSLAFVIPLITAFIYMPLEHDPATQLKTCEEGAVTVASFVIPALICWFLGLGLRLYGKGYSDEIRDIEAFGIVGIGWLLIALIGCLPYIISGTIPNFFGAYFESMSGFTTTGATVLDQPTLANGTKIDYLDAYPHSIMLWRSLTQWLGGMGIIVLSVALLSRFIGGDASLLKAEVPGPTSSRLKPKLRNTARLMWIIYLGFSVIEVILLKIAGMGFYDAVNHTCTTLATGGFSTHAASITYYNNFAIEIILVIFMLIAGTNFVLHYHLILGKTDKKAMFKDVEFRGYIFFVLLAVVLISAILMWKMDTSLITASRRSLFQVVSIMTTTGYATADFGVWPEATQFILIILMMIGGCAGSTGGGIKVVRILVVLKMARREVVKMVRARRIIPIHLGDSTVSEKTASVIVMFFIIYILIFGVASLCMTLMGYDMVSSTSAVAATLGNVGPALGLFGPTVTYSILPFYGKVLLTICMWLGRLEIFAGLFLFFPSSYKKL